MCRYELRDELMFTQRPRDDHLVSTSPPPFFKIDNSCTLTTSPTRYHYQVGPPPRAARLWTRVESARERLRLYEEGAAASYSRYTRLCVVTRSKTDPRKTCSGAITELIVKTHSTNWFRRRA